MTIMFIRNQRGTYHKKVKSVPGNVCDLLRNVFDLFNKEKKSQVCKDDRLILRYKFDQTNRIKLFKNKNHNYI